MHTIQIDDEVYGYLVRNIVAFRETESDVLKRLLGLAARGGVTSTIGKTAPAPTTTANGAFPDPAIADFLNTPAYLVHGNAVERFLAILSWLYKKKPQDFDKVLLLSGRKRRYFAKTAAELEASGNSVMPKRIPDSPFWVVTNNPTQGKKQIVEDVMRMLGYAALTVRTVTATLY